jgi:hypothetical protein
MSKTILLIFISLPAIWYIIFMISIYKDRGSSDSYKKAYEAWIKRDGNAENLSYNEWRSLIAIDPRLVSKEKKE